MSVSGGGGLEPVFARTPHLVRVIARTERLAAVLGEHTPDAAALEELRRDAHLATLRLDGSPIKDAPPPPDDTPTAGAGMAGDGPATTRASWLAVFENREVDARIARAEYAAVRDALDSDDLAPRLLVAPLDALEELHRRLTTGLVDAAAAGTPRVSRQAVHDSSTGRILYHAEAPERIPGRLARLEGWLVSSAAREHGLVVSGVLHHELLDIHPFEAANGRLARAAARLVLRTRGLDPHAVAAPECMLERDAMGYYEDVVASVRRRDLTIWLERWGEAVAGGLRLVARRLGLLDDDPPVRGVAFLEGRDAPAFTIADYRAEVGVGPEESRRDLERLLDTGRIERVPGSRGLRFVTAGPP